MSQSLSLSLSLSSCPHLFLSPSLSLSLCTSKSPLEDIPPPPHAPFPTGTSSPACASMFTKALGAQPQPGALIFKPQTGVRAGGTSLPLPRTSAGPPTDPTSRPNPGVSEASPKAKALNCLQAGLSDPLPGSEAVQAPLGQARRSCPAFVSSTVNPFSPLWGQEPRFLCYHRPPPACPARLAGG